MPRSAVAARRWSLPQLILAALGACLVLFIVGPLLRMLFFASPASLGAAVRDPEVQAAITLTVLTATAATAIGAALGVPLALLLARKMFPGRPVVHAAGSRTGVSVPQQARRGTAQLIPGDDNGRPYVQALIELPVVIPHPVAGMALLLFLGRRSVVGGALAELGLEVVSHVPGIVAAMLFVSAPILVSGAQEAFRGVDPRLERVARTLGDSPWRAFRRVTLPLAGRGILAAAILSWARSVSEFGSIVIITYNPKVASVLIFDRFTTFGLAEAIPAAVLLLLVALAVFALVRLLQPPAQA